ncbi:transglycosylase SLT domain-containing protein [Candidatus Symbiobacter mobilis]|uniref:Membrane-bound lytic murein transglycosylase D n=1 Tax=Candidatus Symbiobacter mobilis CR TaxID=946483 RepID=U5NBS1_9BURK|nr:transglycosylase SLT domain-containing protein [Candidatus Symbiobacter mobilis]AGX87693.1 membrane-bound lytic murein transglycosylase D [Candidatus Symbiobacter mobilis CR]
MLNALRHWIVAATLLLTGCATLEWPLSMQRDVPAPVSTAIPAVPTGATVTPVDPPRATGIRLQPLQPSLLRGQDVHPLTAPQDLWDRIRRGFAMPDLDTELVRERELWYSSRPDYVERMVERGSKYLFHIVEELECRNMPTELALLPFVESAFNPQAISSAKAAGMWQFMPATGRNFDLRQNMFQDDRRDVLASTRAALDYLQKLYDMFGDWHLALAAYNWGEGRVTRAVTQARKAGASASYADLPMPMETRMYVPKLQAVKNIIAAPDAFRIRLPSIPNHPYFQTVEIRQDIDVAVAASLAEISLAEFRSLNPSSTKPVLLAAGHPQILLPWDKAERFQSNLESFTGDRLASWTAWIAPTTLTAREAAKRIGMGEDELRSVNKIPPRMQIRAGSTLVVRRSNGIRHDVSERVAENSYLALAPEVVLRKTWVRARKKESVAQLAARYKLSAASVAQWNKVSSSVTFAKGQKVLVYLPTTAKKRPLRSAQKHAQAATKAKAHTSARSPTRAAPKATKKLGGKAGKTKGKKAAPKTKTRR